jgi:hypothetical protein
MAQKRPKPISKTQPAGLRTAAPLKAQHLLSPVSEVPRQDVDAELKSKVLSQFRDLGVDPSSLGDDNFVNMLLTPSEKRSNAFKKILFSIEPELEAGEFLD